MQTLEYRFIDKSQWGPGPWQDEPDKIQWPDEETGFPCLIVRHPSHGQLCGYVGVPAGHPAFQRSYNDVDVTVHGGLTFSDFCQADPEKSRVCHIVEPGEDDRVWWLGFDCAHAWDFAPGHVATLRLIMPPHLQRTTEEERDEVYRDLAYVRQQVRDLARQLHRAT